MPRAKPDPEAKICEAVLRLAGKQGWNRLTIAQIAKAAGVPLSRAQAIFSDKNRILPALIGWFDDRLAVKLGKIDASDAPRDRLFEIMMARFDLLQEHRAAILSIFSEGRDPSLARLILAAQLRSMRKMLALAKLNPKQFEASLAVLGLLAVHYRTLWEWRKDATGDMSKTMAALDRSLRCAAGFAEILFRRVG